MNIGFDAKRAYLNRSGLGNYSRNLIRSLIDNYSENNYNIFTPYAESTSFNSYLESKSNVKVITPSESFSPAFHSFWRSFLIPSNFSKLKLDLYHGLSAELPVTLMRSKIKQIVTIHDLIFLRYPDLYPQVDAAIYNKKAKYACKKADLVLAISQQTKSDLIQFYKIPEEKIVIEYQTCDSVFYKPQSEEDKKSIKNIYNLPDNFILYVGTIEERKNLLHLVKAISISKESRNFPLVVIGKKKKYFDDVQSFITYNNMNNQVTFLDNIPTHLLPAFYQSSSLFVYPSLFEGFGIPIIEAAFSKVPVITSTDSCFEEAGGPVSIYVNPKNAEEMAAAIDRVLTDSELRNNMIETTYNFVQKFKDVETSKSLMKLYNSLI